MDLTVPPKPRERAKSAGYLNIPSGVQFRNSILTHGDGGSGSILPMDSILGNVRRASDTPLIHIDSSLIDSSEGSDVDNVNRTLCFEPSQQRKLSLHEVLVPMLPKIMASDEDFEEQIYERRKSSITPEHTFGDIKKLVTLSQNYKPGMSLFNVTGQRPMMQQANLGVTNSRDTNLKPSKSVPMIKTPDMETKPTTKKLPKINRRDVNSFAPISL